MNKFEQVSSHDHQMSVAVGEGKVPCLYLGGRGGVGEGRYPCSPP